MSTATDLLLIRAGISYRQLDYWVRQGYIEPRFRRRGTGELAKNGKSGYARDFAPDEERVALRMGRLVNAGITPEVAACIARNATEADGVGHYRLGSGLMLKIYGEAL